MGGNRVCYPYSCATLWHLMWHFCHMWWIFHGCICWSQMVMSPRYDGSSFFFIRWFCPLDMRLYICWSQMVMSPWYDSSIFFYHRWLCPLDMIVLFFLSHGYVPLIWYFILIDNKWLCPLDIIVLIFFYHRWLCPLDMIVLFFFITDGYVPLIW